MVYNLIAAGFTFVGAILWFITAFIKIPSGWDADPRADYRWIGILNGSAAVMTGVAVLVQGIGYLKSN